MRKRYDTVFNLLSAASFAAVAIGVGVNGWFGWQAGHHTTIANLGFDFHWGYVLGGASVVFDIAKVLLPVLIVIAIFAKGRSGIHRAAVILGCLAFWVPISCYSWSSAMGGAIMNRVDSASARGHEVSEEERLRADRDALKAKNPWTPEIAVYRDKPASALEAKIDGQKKDAKWLNSGECKTPTGPSERGFCKDLAVLQEARLTAEMAERDAKRLTEIEEKLSKITPAGTDDPQAKVLAHTFDTSKEDAQEKWSKLFAGLLEGLGLLPALIFLARLLVEDDEPKPLPAPVSAPALSRKDPDTAPEVVLSDGISPDTIADVERIEASVKKARTPRRKKTAEPVPVRSDAAVASLLTNASGPASQEEVIDAVLDDIPHGTVKHSNIVRAVNDAAMRWPDLTGIHPNKVTARLRARPGIKRLPPKKGERAVFYQFEPASA